MVGQAYTDQVYIQDKHQGSQARVSNSVRLREPSSHLSNTNCKLLDDPVRVLQGHACWLGRQQRIHTDRRRARQQEVSYHCYIPEVSSVYKSPHPDCPQLGAPSTNSYISTFFSPNCCALVWDSATASETDTLVCNNMLVPSVETPG